MGVYKVDPLSFDRIRTYPLAARKRKVTVRSPADGARQRQIDAAPHACHTSFHLNRAV